MEVPKPSPDLMRLKLPQGEALPKRANRRSYDPVVIAEHFAPLLEKMPKPTPAQRLAHKVDAKFMWRTPLH